MSGHVGLRRDLKTETTSEELLEEALDLIIVLQSSPNDESLKKDLSAWLARSDAHKAAWKEACETWQALGEIPPVFTHVWGRPEPALRSCAPVRSFRRKSLPLLGGLAAAVLMLVLFLVGPDAARRLQADALTRLGESKTMRLDDGSTIMLAADSAVRVRYTHESRDVDLLAGEAYFDVAKDQARPFNVLTNGVRVTVHGTAFDVRLASAEATIALERGAVAVAYGEGPGTFMVPGDEVNVDLKTGEMTSHQVAVSEIALWRNGRLFVNGVRISEVVEQLRHYHRGWIEISDAELAERRVTGLYDLHDPERALRALAEPFGGKVRSFSPYVLVLSSQ